MRDGELRAQAGASQARESGLSQGPCQGVQKEIQDQRGEVVGKAWGEVILADSTFREEHKSCLVRASLIPPPTTPLPKEKLLSSSKCNSETFEVPFWGHNPSRLFTRASVGTRDHLPGQP